MNKMKKVFSLSMILALSTTMLGACGGKDKANTTNTDNTATSTPTEAAATEEATPTAAQDETATTSEPKVIRYGTHYVQDLDPNYVDDVTGEYTMAEDKRQAYLAALDAIKEQYNVEFEFVQYADDTRNELMTSVLAGDPVCDLATIWGGAEGTILAQNVLQEIDAYKDIFSDEGVSWMLDDQLYGHYYLLSFTERFYQRWPLIYNISMIDKVDTLKDDSGKTIYPTDLFLAGDWTWSKFQDYLSKIQAYYANTEVSNCTLPTVQAYETDHRFAGLSAMYSNGGGIYTANGLSVNSEESVKALQWISDMMDAKVMVDCGTYDDGYTPKWCQGSYDFAAGGTVFTDCPDWLINNCASQCSDRGEAIGMIPYPRPDDLSMDDPKYQQAITLGDSVGVLKGVDAETTELALKAYALFWKTYYENFGGVDDIVDYKKENAAATAASVGIDVYNETYGNDMLQCFQYISEHLANDYSDLLGLRVTWDDVFGKGLYGVDGTAAYNVAIESELSSFSKVIDNMTSILSSDEIRDNMGPNLSATTVALPIGTDLSKVDWSQYFTAEDAVDGTLDLANGTFTYGDSVDMNTPGKYDDGVKLTISDASGNEGSKSVSVSVYDPDNKKAPTVEVVDPLPTVALDTDVSTIVLKDNFIKSATDVAGLNLSENITADWSTLDTSTPGTYDVVVTVTDYAGNTTDVTLSIEVASADK